MCNQIVLYYNTVHNHSSTRSCCRVSARHLFSTSSSWCLCVTNIYDTSDTVPFLRGYSCYHGQGRHHNDCRCRYRNQRMNINPPPPILPRQPHTPIPYYPTYPARRVLESDGSPCILPVQSHQLTILLPILGGAVLIYSGNNNRNTSSNNYQSNNVQPMLHTSYDLLQLEERVGKSNIPTPTPN